MWSFLITNVVLPFAVDTVKSYIKSTDSKKDDKVLEVVQIGASYLANKPNNTVNQDISNNLNVQSMKTLQKVR